MRTTITTIPAVGQWISTLHVCRIDNTRAAREDNIREHRAPVRIQAVVKLGGANGDWRVETTRCDGSAMHLILNADGTEIGEETGTGYEVVDAPESAWCSACDPVATPRHFTAEHYTSNAVSA